MKESFNHSLANTPGVFGILGRLIQFRNSRHRHVDRLDLIPGRVVYDPADRQVEQPLERHHRLSRIFVVISVDLHPRQRTVYFCNRVQLLLKLTYLLPGSADIQIISRPGGWNPGNLLRSIDIHILAVKTSEDLNRRISLFPQFLTLPLSHPSSNNICTYFSCVFKSLGI